MPRNLMTGFAWILIATCLGSPGYGEPFSSTGSPGITAGESRDRGSGIEVLYVVEFTHADVGFNAPPSVMQVHNYNRTREALDLADLHPDFHWTVETSYQLESFMDRASQADIDRLKARLAEGRFAIGSNYLNLHSGLCGDEQLNRLPYPGAYYAPLLDYSPVTALLNDVPGFSMAIPRILSSAGAPYAILGANDFIGGKPDIPLQDRPFWWEARDGSRTLTWLTYGSYIEGFFEWGLVNIPGMLNNIPARVQEFEDAGYPYDALLVCRASDDNFPTATMVDLAAQWNASYTPRIELATPSDFFDHMIDTYGEAFPVYRGDASGFWEDVCTTTPVSLGYVRRARTMLPAVEALWTLITHYTGLPYPGEEFRQAWNLSMTLDEHSNGGYGWPGLLNENQIRQENIEFVAVARGCDGITRDLLRQGLDQVGSRLVPEGESGLVFFNPLGEAFEGIVEVECGSAQESDLRLADPDGGPDAVFRWLDEDRTRIAMNVSVPARGWRRWEVTDGGSAPPPPTWTETDSITVRDLHLIVDDSSGTASNLVQLSTSFDWLEQSGPHRFGGIETAPHFDEFFGLWSGLNPSPVTILAEEPAPLFRRLRVSFAGDRLFREYRLYEEERRLDVTISMRTSALPFVPYDDHSHHYGVSFPANLEIPTTLWIDGPDGGYVPGTESLAGTNLGHFAASTGARLEGAGGRWLSITSLDTPMLNPGEMNGAWQDYVETDEVALTWKLRRHADLSEVAGGDLVPMEAEPGMPDDVPYRFTVRFGDAGELPPDRETLRHDIAPPVSAWVEAGESAGTPPAWQSMIGLEGSAELICMKRSEADDGMILRLRSGETGGTVELSPRHDPSSAWITDLVERPIEEIPIAGGSVAVTMVPYGVTTILLRD